MSLLDALLANDPDGDIHVAVARQQADLDAGITWGVFDRGTLLATYPSKGQADAEARDCADAVNRPLSDFAVRPVASAQGQVAA